MNIQDILISASLIIIFSYIFDVFSSKTKLPAVVPLLLLGAGIKLVAVFLGFDVVTFQHRITAILPLLGTLGLILIVLEGALELDINASKKGMILKSFAAALLVLLATISAIWAILVYGFQQDSNLALLNAIPLAVISSAIAIPSVANLRAYEKEFIIYESSFSDILGVLIFNFALTNKVINAASFSQLGYELLFIFIISIVATVSLGFLFERLGQHKKFVLILAILFFFYGIAKHFHLSALVLIFIFGLFAGNNEFFINALFKQRFKMDVLQREIHHFQSFVMEFAFVFRTFFFVVFGASIDSSGLLNLDKWALASLIFLAIYLLRFFYFKATRDDKDNLLWYVAPRGLITILLFYSIPDEQKLAILDQDVLLMVILGSVFILAFGSILNAKKSGSTADSISNENQ
jgi:NhaP-type Na+/H+ or K+/H+ antiporter